MRLPVIIIIIILVFALAITAKAFLINSYDDTELISPLAKNQVSSNTNGYVNNNSMATPSIITPTPTIPPIITPTPSPSQSPEPTTKEEKAEFVEVYVTYYGWHDNDPPGNKIAYPKKYYNEAIHDTTGGTGTYTDPITFASDKDLFEVGTILYVPYIKKYIVMEDQCSTCEENWDNVKKHIDIWMSSDDDNEDELYDCQEYWTRSKTKIEINPPKNREVNLAPLFDKENGECLKTI